MREFRASLVKEVLLLRRDLGALVILFVMPLLLVVSVSMVQHGTFRSMTEVQVDALRDYLVELGPVHALVNNAGGALGVASVENSSARSVCALVRLPLCTITMPKGAFT